jgi:UDP-N-acetyl-D-glucosamine dehydrogenase
MPHYVVRRVTAALNEHRKPVNGSRIVVLGVSYKPNVGDTRETPARPIIEQLAGLGAELTVVDRFAAATTDSFAGQPLHAEATPEALAGCDLAILLTDHEHLDYDEVARLAPHVLDTRARIDPGAVNVERL